MKRMRKAFIFLILTIMYISGYSQSTSLDTIIYMFMNSTICKIDTENFNLEESSNEFHIYRDTTRFLTDTSLFSKEDIDFFRIQIKKIEKFKWNGSLLKGANVIPDSVLSRVFKKDNGWRKFRRKFGKCLSSYSMPIFDKNFEYCIIQVGAQCDWLAGRGGTNVYKFTNGEWVFVKRYSVWVS